MIQDIARTEVGDNVVVLQICEHCDLPLAYAQKLLCPVSFFNFNVGFAFTRDGPGDFQLPCSHEKASRVVHSQIHVAETTVPDASASDPLGDSDHSRVGF
jgi:hypothetical protein